MSQNNIESIIRLEATAILNIPMENDYHKAVEIIVKQTGKVITSGVGKAGQIALNIATTFCSIGIPAVFMHPTEAQHGDIGMLQKNDCLLIVSNSGKTQELIDFVKLAKVLVKNIPVILITGHPERELALQPTCILATGNPDEVCILGLVPTTSTTVMTVIGDILVVLLENWFRINKEDYAKYHHGGYIGHQLKTK